ncbi:PBS lyase, partial [Burkholderia multivorans]
MTSSASAFPPSDAYDADDADHAALLARLAASDASVRRVALFELADLEDAALVPAFVAVLRDDPSAEVRCEAARVLGA